MVRILLADDHPLVMEGFKKILESDPTYHCVGSVEDGHALVREAQRLKPDLALIDISMPRLNGLEAARSLKRALPTVKLVFVTMHAERFYVTEAFRAGASAYLLKHGSSEELFFALREVLKGRTYITTMIAGEFLTDASQHLRRPDRQSSGLTARQREILQLVAEGYTNKAIATTLRISDKTVEFHKTHIGRVLGIRTTAELTRYACAHGLVPSPSLVADTASRHDGRPSAAATEVVPIAATHPRGHVLRDNGMAQPAPGTAMKNGRGEA